MKRVVILQPSYIPWLGYFDQIQKADLFVFYDDVQYTRRDWRNRNRIKTPQGPHYLTVPVQKAPRDSLIHSIQVSDTQQWREEHLKTLEWNYKRAPFFDRIHPLIQNWLVPAPSLSSVCIHFVEEVANFLSLETELHRSSTIPTTSQDPTDRLIEICQKVGATHYLTGDAARDYLAIDRFQKEGIELEFHGYQHPEYPQLWGDFTPYLSVVDALYNLGQGALK